MVFKSISAAITFLVVVTFNVNAALIERLGGFAYYDDVADLTWLADANYAQTSGYDADGAMTWDESMAWVSGLNVGGVTGWRLPDTIDVGNDGATAGGNVYQGVDYGLNITTHSELSNMYYNVLGNIASSDTAGNDNGCRFVLPDDCLINTAPFSNLQSEFYWSATEYAPETSRAWNFNMGYGSQNHYIKSTFSYYAWAVHSGDVNNAPTVNAGTDQTVTANTTVTLSGTASDDGSITTYWWTQASGTPVTLNVTDTVDSSFTAPDVSSTEILVFSFTVTDNDGVTASDEISITIHPVISNDEENSTSSGSINPIALFLLSLMICFKRR